MSAPMRGPEGQACSRDRPAAGVPADGLAAGVPADGLAAGADTSG